MKKKTIVMVKTVYMSHLALKQNSRGKEGVSFEKVCLINIQLWYKRK